jgi:hypothetical protein
VESRAQKDNDFPLQNLAFGTPIPCGLESFYAPAGMRHGNAPGTEFGQFGEPFFEKLEEPEFKSVSLQGEVMEGNSQGWRGKFHSFADVFETDLAENKPNAGGEFLERNSGAGEIVAQVEHEAAGDVAGEPPFGVPGTLGGILNRGFNPLGTIGGEFVSSDAKERKVGWKSDHRDGRRWKGRLREKFRVENVAWDTTSHGVDLIDEFTHILELPVHAGVADIGDGIYSMQAVHDLDSQSLSWYFTEAVTLQFGDDFVGGLLEFFPAYRPLLAGLSQTTEELLPVERLPAAVPFDDDNVGGFDGLVGRESVTTGETLPPPPDGGPFPRDPGINHLVLVFVAFRAAHKGMRGSISH